MYMRDHAVLIGVATGILAGAVVTAIAGTALANPKTRKMVERTTDKALDMAKDVTQKFM